MPPAPPTTGSIAAITRLPLLLSVVITLTIELDPAGAAGIRSGIARPKAPKIRLRNRPASCQRRRGPPPFLSAECAKGRVSPMLSKMLGLSV